MNDPLLQSLLDLKNLITKRGHVAYYGKDHTVYGYETGAMVYALTINNGGSYRLGMAWNLGDNQVIPVAGCEFTDFGIQGIVKGKDLVNDMENEGI